MRLFIGAFCVALSIAVTASAQSCGGIYKIKGVIPYRGSQIINIRTRDSGSQFLTPIRIRLGIAQIKFGWVSV